MTEYYNDASDIDIATDIAVTAETTTAGIDAVLAEGGHISGTVTNSAGAALANIAVQVYQNQGGGWYSAGSATTDGTGQYDVSGLATGTYRVGFQDWGWPGTYLTEYYDDALNLEGATESP